MELKEVLRRFQPQNNLDFQFLAIYNRWVERWGRKEIQRNSFCELIHGVKEFLNGAVEQNATQPSWLGIIGR